MHVRIANLSGESMDSDLEDLPPRQRSVWWFVVLIVLNFITLINVHYSNHTIRRELDENATLIRQLQERQVVRDLANIRKGTP